LKEIAQFIECLKIGSWQVEATDTVLSYCRRFSGNGMKFLIVAKYDPVVSTANFEPLIVSHILRKIVGFAVMPFNPEWRLHVSKCLGKALAKIAVKIKG
jgi:hypothetical protein